MDLGGLNQSPQGVVSSAKTAEGIIRLRVKQKRTIGDDILTQRP